MKFLFLHHNRSSRKSASFGRKGPSWGRYLWFGSCCVGRMGHSIYNKKNRCYASNPLLFFSRTMTCGVAVHLS